MFLMCVLSKTDKANAGKLKGKDISKSQKHKAVKCFEMEMRKKETGQNFMLK